MVDSADQCYLKTNWEKPKREQKGIMNDKLKAVKITITYYGVGLSKDEAIFNAWNDISNDRDYQIGKVVETDCEVDEANFDPLYLDILLKSEGE
jgi:hypothetical protein